MDETAYSRQMPNTIRIRLESRTKIVLRLMGPKRIYCLGRGHGGASIMSLFCVATSICLSWAFNCDAIALRSFCLAGIRRRVRLRMMGKLTRAASR